MRIVATSDTHHFVDPTVIPDGDVFIHAGDLMNRGHVLEWEDCLAWMAVLPLKRKIYVPGNHDFHVQLYPGPAMQELKWAGIEVLGHPLGRHRTELANGMTIIGSPWVTGLKRWAFNTDETTINCHIFNAGKADIVVTHSPIYGILDEVVTGTKKKATDEGLIEEPEITHTGVKTYIDYLYKFKPKYWIHGHIHECYGQTTIEETGTIVYNVSLCDLQYKHRNPPLVLDV